MSLEVLAGLRQRWQGQARVHVLTGMEFLVVALWTLAIVYPYLDFDPAVLPTGTEYSSAIQPYHAWVRFRECGACAMWNGSVRGGVPALVDVHASLLHPLVGLPTLIWGVPIGAKLALTGAFLLAGLAQWWLGRVLGLGRMARTWGACMAVAAGNVGGRMDGGWINVVIATAACALVFPPLISLTRTGHRRWAVVLGAALALAAVAGQGYLQIGLVLTLPALILLIDPQRAGLLARRYSLAVGLAALMAALFLIPFLHFLPHFGKDLDPAFRTAQPFAFMPLNLVINDVRFYATDALGKAPFAGLYVNFIGWIPIVFALWALHTHRGRDERRMVYYLLLVATLALWFGSATPLRWIMNALPLQGLRDWVAGIRNTALVAGLAVTPLLALAAMGLEDLLDDRWPKLRLSVALGERPSHRLALGARWLLTIPVVLAMMQAARFDAKWVRTYRVPAIVAEELAGLRTPSLQWVSPPFGEHVFIEQGVRMGLKLASDLKPWHWEGRDNPKPLLEASRTGPPAGMTLHTQAGGITVYVGPPEREYASVEHDNGRTACAAEGTGGDIDVVCQADRAGRLVVKEHYWSGWRAYVDGERVQLEDAQWLTVPLESGRHEIRFRYRPWDVPLGLLLSVLGLLLAVSHWRRG